MREYFLISGYWKDDKSEFSDYLVTNFDDAEEEEDNVFYYGLEETEIKSILNEEDNILDFVITSYRKTTTD